jgi:DNA-binding NtrC family response regulator
MCLTFATRMPLKIKNGQAGAKVLNYNAGLFDFTVQHQVVPAMPTSNHGEHIMCLPLREVFEYDYPVAQISRFSGIISRTAEFVDMERSALHRKLKAFGVG